MTNEVQSVNNLPISTKSKQELLRKSKSTPKLRGFSSPATSSSTLPTINTKKKQKRKQSTKSSTTTNGSIPGFFRKLSTEWSSFLSKLKSISDDVLTTDDIAEEFFIEEDSDDTGFDKLMRSHRGYNSTEEKFLQEYKKYKSLDTMAAAYQKNHHHHHHHHNKPNNSGYSNEIKTCNSHVSEPTNMSSNFTGSSNKVHYTLQDVMRQQQQLLLQQQQRPFSDALLPNGDEFEILEEDDEDGESTAAEIVYNDIDMIELRKEFEMWVNSKNTSDTDSKSTLFSQSNIGTTLWEYRRNKWLICNDPEKFETRLQETSISHIPKESYAKIYTNLIEKNKTLKNNKHINLLDLVKIINAGWIAEEKWDRAARGLP